jgi:hypothetical protein
LGVGALLLRMLEALARHTHMHKVMATVFSFNAPAQAIWVSIG